MGCTIDHARERRKIDEWSARIVDAAEVALRLQAENDQLRAEVAAWQEAVDWESVRGMDPHRLRARVKATLAMWRGHEP